MAAKSIEMKTLQQIIQLRQSGQGYRSIANLLGISKNTVKKYIRELEEQGISLSESSTFDESALSKLFSQSTPKRSQKYEQLCDWFPYMDKELKRVGVNRWMLWEEYKRKYPSVYNYSYFCHNYHQWKKNN